MNRGDRLGRINLGGRTMDRSTRWKHTCSSQRVGGERVASECSGSLMG
jgi:hypothetical protein